MKTVYSKILNLFVFLSILVIFFISIFAFVFGEYKFTNRMILYSNDAERALLLPWEKIDSFAYDRIQLKEARKIISNASNVRIGIVDTGISVSHAEMKGRANAEYSYDANPGSASPLTDFEAHGTSVASVICNNNKHLNRICDDVQLCSLKIQNEKNPATVWKLASAINFASRNGIKILNISLGGNEEDPTLKEAIENYDGLIITAAGNRDQNIDDYPTYLPSYTYENILVIGASTAYDEKYVLSNYSSTKVDLFAPGDMIPCIYDNDYYYSSGTSMAAPFVTGVAALILAKYPDMHPLHLKRTIMNNVDRAETLRGLCVTGGRLNAYNSLRNPDQHMNVCTPVNNSLTYHHAKCSICGYETTEPHSWYNFKGTNRCSCGMTAGIVPIKPGTLALDENNEQVCENLLGEICEFNETKKSI